MSPTKIPEGYWENQRGELVPIANIKEIDIRRDELVRGIIEKAEAHAQAIAEFRETTFAEVEEFVQESASKYKAKLGGVKGNVQLLTYDGSYKVQVANSETIAFGEQLQAAHELIQKCIRKWSEGARPEILALINDAFQVDKAGNISTSRVLGLKRLDISDPDWQRAMKAISDSLQVVASKRYIRVYKRQPDGSYKHIALDVASS